MSALRRVLLGVGVFAGSIALSAPVALAGGNPQAVGAPERPSAEKTKSPMPVVTAGSPGVVCSPWGHDPLVWLYLRRAALDAIQREAAQRQMLYQEVSYRQARNLAHAQRLRQEAWYRGEVGRQAVRKQLSRRPADRTAAAAHGKDHGPSPEQRASAKLQLARLLRSEGHRSDARDYCQDIIATYSGTPAAQEAKSLLGKTK